MKLHYFTKTLSAPLLCFVIVMAGCCINIGCIPQAKCERKVQLSATLQPGSTFATKTHNGSITIEGADVADCNLTATIIARASTEEDAKKLADKVKIKLEPSGNKLNVRIEKPDNKMNRSVSVSLDVIVPNETNLELTTHNGAIKIANITGNINGTTHNGKVVAEKTCGTTNLKTHNGSVVCEETSGDTQLKTHNGSVKLYYCEAAPATCNISAVTHNGGIDFTAPPNLSAEVDISTHNGSIKTDLPITLTGEVSKKKLTGIIGTGEGKLHLETHNGSIKIK
jgi:hypothetical protein